jgi:hypothetical protein
MQTLKESGLRSGTHPQNTIVVSFLYFLIISRSPGLVSHTLLSAHHGLLVSPFVLKHVDFLDEHSLLID